MRNLFFILSTLFFQVLLAQDSLHFKTGPYKIELYTAHDRLIDGYLNSINDTSIEITSKQVFFQGYVSDGSPKKAISYPDISWVSLKRKGGVGRGMLLGVLGGAAIGAIVGAASGDDTDSPGHWCIPCLSAGEKAATGGVLLGIAGGLVGGMVGSLLAQQTFRIKGKKEKFDEMRWALVH
jgi:hypothetical protein